MAESLFDYIAEIQATNPMKARVNQAELASHNLLRRRGTLTTC
jgi:hypothetical protein